MANTNYLTTDEVLSVLKVGRTTLYRFIDKGVLTRYKLGSRLVRFDENQVRSLMNHPKETKAVTLTSSKGARE